MSYFQTGNYHETARNFLIPTSSVKYMVENEYHRKKKKRGPKKLISNKENSMIKREVNRLKQAKERVTSTKVVSNLNLPYSPKTMQRELKDMNLIYKKIPRKSFYLKVTKREEWRRQKSGCPSNTHGQKQFSLMKKNSTWMDQIHGAPGCMRGKNRSEICGRWVVDLSWSGECYFRLAMFAFFE